ncbi:ImuA family protein [Antarcticirhabdus aurantiaca]|uniref:Uncharacterized protein n=1 Tax=Antarcticirhabdus aurantiaca TaxID=2606717 RepID=A0ACD4NHM6_9HYPH|nr:hypothetical protein [Antarcticirhabdus aurantiaca]WAJ26267.1 hypothetical protein OXU80_15280 [Jeongeuplla avenae]
MGDVLADLRRSLAAIEAGRGAGLAAAPRPRLDAHGFRDAWERSRSETSDGGEGSFSFGMASIDARVGPMPVGALHEIRAASQNDGPAAGGFTIALMLRAMAGTGTRRAAIVRQSMTAAEFGEMHGAGLLALGADPGELLLARTRDGLGSLQAGLEALRSPGIGAVAIEIWGDPRALDLDATRRLAVAARRSGAAAFLLRVGAPDGAPSAAHARWRVRAGVSTPLAAGAPGHPVFEIELLRHRAGLPQQTWRVEWSRDARTFRDPSIPVPVAAVSPHRSLGAGGAEPGRHALRRAG